MSRQRLWEAMVALAPPGTAKTWQALARAVPEPVDPALVGRLSVSPPAAAELRQPLLDQTAARLAAAALALVRRRTDALYRRQGGAIAGIMLGLWLLAAGALVVNRAFEPVDLAKGAPWRASSSWGSCDPERGVCGPL